MTAKWIIRVVLILLFLVDYAAAACDAAITRILVMFRLETNDFQRLASFTPYCGSPYTCL